MTVSTCEPTVFPGCAIAVLHCGLQDVEGRHWRQPVKRVCTEQCSFFTPVRNPSLIGRSHLTAVASPTQVEQLHVGMPVKHLWHVQLGGPCIMQMNA